MAKRKVVKKKVNCFSILLVTIFLFQLSILPSFKSRIISEAMAINLNATKNYTYIQPKFVPDEIIVKFKNGIKQEKRNDLLTKHNTTIKSINHRAGFMRLKIHDKGMSIRKIVQKFKNNKEVEYAEPNYLVHICLTPDDPSYSDLWGLNNTGQTGGTPDADIDAPEAWDIQTGDPSVVVAVIDTGTDYNHEDLSSNMWANPGEIPANGLDDDGNGFIDDVRGWDFVNNDNDPMDDHSHGTHCAGTIAALGDNGIGVVGVNWAGRIMPLKFLNAAGSGTTTDAILAIQYATQMGANIMSNSWGGGGFSQALKDAITNAHEAGLVFTAAAGNNGMNNDVMPYYPACYDVPNVIAVAATDHNDALAWFSNYGVNSVALGAPGVSILSTTPNNNYGYKSGTSMATPHVAGAAALLWAEFPALTNEEIKAGILDSVDIIPALTGKTITEGRLNAYSALIGVVPPPPPVPVTVFQDDMENGINGWAVSGEALWDQSTNRSVSPNTSWYYGIEGVYTYNTGERTFGSLTSPSIDLTDITSSKLVFIHFLETENYPPYDTATVRITKDGGITYTDVFSKTTTVGAFLEETLDISEFDGYIIQVQFFFDTLDDLFNNFEGWYIDDVIVKGETIGPPPNQLPVADAGPAQTVTDADGNGYEAVTLDGSGSYDPDGVIVSYEWKEGATVLGTGVSISYDFSVAGSPHTVTLTVTDDMGATDTDEVIITVNPNQLPVAVAGPDQTVTDADGNGYETITLDGSGSYDPDWSIVAYEWKEGATVLGTGISIPYDFSVAGSPHTVTLIVTDDMGATDTDEVIITVNPNQLPVADAGPDQTVTDADGNGYETITLDASGSYDPDGSIVSYEWKEGATILGTGASISYDFSVSGSPHTVTLTVTDDMGGTDTDEVIITVNPNQLPVADAGPDQTVTDADGNGYETITLDGSGSYDPDGVIGGYEWKEGATVLGTGVSISYDFSVAGSPHTVTLTVTDDMSATDTDEVIITVNPNQLPVADAGPDQAVTDADGNGYETITLDGSGSYDPDWSIVAYEWKEGATVLGTGISIPYDFSVAGSPHTVTLTVIDNGNLTHTDFCTVTISEMPSNIMHVGDISMITTDRSAGKNIFTYATATVHILDATGMPVEGATVSGYWTGLTSDTDFGLTAADGKVSLTSDQKKNASGTFTFTVDDVTLAGWIYDPSANVETSDSVTR